MSKLLFRKRRLGRRRIYVGLLGSLAILGGVNGANDELGRQKAVRVQKGVWEGVPPPEESHGTVFILNTDAIRRDCDY